MNSDPRDRARGLVLAWGARILRAPVGVRVLISTILLVFVAFLDGATPREVSYSIFYLIPVSFAGGFVSHRLGLVFAILSAVMWGYLEAVREPPYSAAWIPIWNSCVRLGFFLLVNELIERLRQAYAKEQALARTDSLTGIANAHVFRENLGWVIALSRRNGQPFAIAYIDLDRFKNVNDQFGHAEGDKLLRTIAILLATNVRSTDIVARLGGDEFGILMADTEAIEVTATLERLAAIVSQRVGARWNVGITVGAVTFHQPPKDVDCAISLADSLMYQGKTDGRGKIVQGAWPTAVDVVHDVVHDVVNESRSHSARVPF